MICCASWPGVEPVGTKPVVLEFPLGSTTLTTTTAIAATTASAPAITMITSLRLFRSGGLPCLPVGAGGRMYGGS